MEKVTNIEELKEAIARLEYKHKLQWEELKDNIGEAFESVKPINLLRSTYRDFLSTPNMPENVIGSILGLTTGFVTRKLIVKKSGNIVRNFAGGLAQMLITNFMSRYSGSFKAIGSGLLHKIFFKNKVRTVKV
jgi:hypothetical protein